MISQVCIIQDAPVFFDKEKSMVKLEALVAQHASSECKLIVFPESFIPGYPRGFSFGATIGSRSSEGRDLYATYYHSSLNLQGEDRQRLERISREHQVYLIIGATEQAPLTGSLYCSMIYISPTHGLLGVHRKIKPTGTERLIWAEADGTSLVSYDTTIGRMGGLICWENYMPLARMSMYQQGVEIYVAPTADARDEWIATLQHIALEGRCFVLGCNQYMTKSMYPKKYQPLLREEPEEMCRGGSVIISPLGQIMAGPLYHQAGVVRAHIDLDDIIKSKLDFDVNGHYGRPDIFQLEVKGQPAISKEDESD